MTEITDNTVDLAPTIRRFVLQWGDMGGQWGVNRSVSQIHALLYLSERPLTAEEIADTLSMARSNVSNSLKELLAWGLIHRAPVLGGRRDRFEADIDIWSVAAKIAAGRKAREIDPALAALEACLLEAEGDSGIGPAARTRLKEMHDFTRTVSSWYAQMSAVPRPKLLALIRLGTRIVNLLPGRKT